MFKSQRYLILFLAFIALLGIGCRDENSQGQSKNVIPDKRIELVTKSEGGSQPFFRAALTFKNSDGKDAKLPESREELRKAIKVKTVGKKGIDESPFYVSFGSQTAEETAPASTTHDILLLFDVSGSMLGKDIQPSRFVAAQQAAAELLNKLSPNYRVAVAPFESVGVRAKIEGAEFKSPKEAVNSINSLPQPQNGNTALYSAVDFAIDVLKKRKYENKSQEQSLIVLTDGRNDVRPPSDQNLLDENSFQKIVNKVRESNLRVFTIGIGKSRQESNIDLAFDEDKLKELAYHESETRYFKAENLGDLSARFKVVVDSVSRVVNITFCTQGKNISLYDLRSLKFDITYNLPGSGQLRGQIPWICRNSITGCIPEKSGVLSREENNLAMGSSCGSQNASVWQPLLWLFGQLALFSGGIAALWMFVPALIWPSIPLPSLPLRGKPKTLPSSAKPSSRSRSSEPDEATASKPRQRFEETRIYDNSGRRSDQRDK